jgi:hypothetical protein
MEMSAGGWRPDTVKNADVARRSAVTALWWSLLERMSGRETSREDE